MIARVFEEAERRDPKHRRTWVALVDGANHQIERIKPEARKRKVKVTIVVDFVHVLEYLWTAAGCLIPTTTRGRAVGAPPGDQGARRTRPQGRRQHPPPSDQPPPPGTSRKPADEPAAYLTSKAPYLEYPTALANGWPIATGIVEGACRHLVKDRMDLTGARWGLAGAEAILSYAPSKPTVTSRRTGATTSPKNNTTSTKPATTITSSQPMARHTPSLEEEPHPLETATIPRASMRNC